jgi:phage FluMu protein Com
MTVVFSSNNLQQCLLLKEIFESEGISCLLRHEDLSSTNGELPSEQAWPELCILNDSDIFKTEKILAEYETELGDLPSFCPKCDSEEIDFQKKAGLIGSATFRCRKCNHVWRRS